MMAPAAVVADRIEDQLLGARGEVIALAPAALRTVPVAARMIQPADFPTLVALVGATAQCSGAAQRQLGQRALHLRASPAVGILTHVGRRADSQDLGHRQFFRGLFWFG